MVSTAKDPVLAVLSLSGGNDGLNTVIPRNNGYYRDFRPTIGVPEDQILPINDDLGFHPTMAPLMKFWEAGQLAVFVGIGYPTPATRTSAAWTSGTPASRKSSAPRAGWAAPPS